MTRGEEGAGTVLAAGLALAMLLLMALVLGLGQAAVAAAKAATAADLAALAAADAYRGLVPGEPCRIAADVAMRHGAELLACTLAGDLSVQVQVQGAASVMVPWQASGKSRAGPPPDTAGPGPP
ncbi:Rv3654c family TadE-like protein [Specibacter sp. AOP5-B1-6]|uniref:Rv3654c family TadE-like protein n=1 Tax=Specibacter sp. AOP5-B1-6 TaxID=3457653 RepID=UPI003FB743BE